MTTTQTQLRRDTATNLNAATPAAGEPGWDTTNKRLVVGDGSTTGGIKITMAKDAQNQTYTAGTVGGTGDAITLTNSPVVAAYATNQRFTFKAGAANTGATTLNVDGLGAKNVKKMRNGALSALVANDIISGGMYDVWYDGTQFQIKGLEEGPFTSGALVYLDTKTASGSPTLDFTSLMSSTYDDYVLIYENVVPATSGAKLLVLLSSDNGATWMSTNYVSGFSKAPASTGTPSGVSGPSSSFQLTDSLSNNAIVPCAGEFKLYGVNTGNRCSVSWEGANNDNSGSFAAANVFSTKGGGQQQTAATFNALQVKTALCQN
jgi:hypothetical protein